MESVTLNTYRPLAAQNARAKLDTQRAENTAAQSKDSATSAVVSVQVETPAAAPAKSVNVAPPASPEKDAAKNEAKEVPQTLEQVLERAADQIQNVLPDLGLNTQLRIRKDETSGRFIYQNIDRASGEVVSQQPPEEVLNRVASVREVFGLVVDDKA